MSESETVAAMRRDLGRQLAAHRQAAGYLQRELGALTGYSRTAIANAELGSTQSSRHLWEEADRVLKTGELFAHGYDRLKAQSMSEAEVSAKRLASAPGPEAPEREPTPLQSQSPGEARQACLDRGWPAEQDHEGRLRLVTGTAIDVLEVPRLAGLVAISWWLYTRGAPDEIRGLPALPDPASSLAAISAGPSCYFLTRSGACPWSRRDLAAAGHNPVGPPIVHWHARGGRIPAPPTRLDTGERVTWAHVPSTDCQLVSPMALLHVLAQATAATQDGPGLVLPGGVRALPAATPSPAGMGQ